MSLLPECRDLRDESSATFWPPELPSDHSVTPELAQDPRLRFFRLKVEITVDVYGLPTDEEPTIQVVGKTAVREGTEVIMEVSPRTADGAPTEQFDTLGEAGRAAEDSIHVRWTERHMNFVPEPQEGTGSA